MKKRNKIRKSGEGGGIDKTDKKRLIQLKSVGIKVCHTPSPHKRFRFIHNSPCLVLSLSPPWEQKEVGARSSPCWLGELPATRQMNAVDSRRVGQEQLQLCKQGEVIRGDVGMGAASDIVLVEPVGVQGTQYTQHVEQRLRVEDVVNDALKKKKEKEHYNCRTDGFYSR